MELKPNVATSPGFPAASAVFECTGRPTWKRKMNVDGRFSSTLPNMIKTPSSLQIYRAPAPNKANIAFEPFAFTVKLPLIQLNLHFTFILKVRLLARRLPEALHVPLKAVFWKCGSLGCCGVEHTQMRTVGHKSCNVRIITPSNSP